MFLEEFSERPADEPARPAPTFGEFLGILRDRRR
jgi:hypothetical protein